MHKYCLAIQAQARMCWSRHVSGGIDGVIGHRSPKDGFRSGAFSEKDLNLGRAAWAGCNYKCVGEIFCNDSHKNLTKFQREFEVVFVGFDFRIHAWIWRRNCAKERGKLLLVIYLFICLTFWVTMRCLGSEPLTGHEGRNLQLYYIYILYIHICIYKLVILSVSLTERQ